MLPRTLAAIVLLSSAMAHDGDAKVRSRRMPISGPGYSAAAPNLAGAMAAGSFDSSGLQLESWVPLNLIDSATNANDCWGYTSPSGREYAILGTSSGTAFFEVTDPQAPVQVGYLPGPNSLWRDIRTFGTHAYMVSEGGSGIQVVDMGSIDAGHVSLANTVTGPGTDSTHNVSLDETSGFLYRLGGGNEGLRAYDLSDPSKPTYVATWSERYIHDAQFVTYTTGPLAGRELCFACGGLNGSSVDAALTVLDVTDKQNIVLIEKEYYPNASTSHQGWLSEDRTRYYLADEGDENGTTPSTVYVFDVEDPYDISYLNKFDNGQLATTHNLFVRGNHIFAANYSTGLRVFDLSVSDTHPPETAYFDGHPEGDGTGFNGLWGVYPFLPSGTIVGSDMERGLFLWRLESSSVEIAWPAGAPTTLHPGGDRIEVTLSDPSQVASARVVLEAPNAGSYPLTQVAGTTFAADLPGLPCHVDVSWFVEVLDTSGRVARDPALAPALPRVTPVSYGERTVFADDGELDLGWALGVPSDDATAGQWTRGDPHGSAAQPEDDHSTSGTWCWFTGQGAPGADPQDHDVDGGVTTLESPPFDVAGLSDPHLEFWLWYSTQLGYGAFEDRLTVEFSSNGGVSWIIVLRIGPAGPGTSGGWSEYRLRLAEYITLTSDVRVRFRVQDTGDESIVEAALDDVRLLDLGCDVDPGAGYCQAAVNSTGFPAALSALGSAEVAQGELVLFSTLMPPNQFGYFLASQTQGFVQPPGSQGNLCLGGAIRRFSSSVLDSGPLGRFHLHVDLAAIPGHGAVQPGDTWSFQAWFRDVGATSNFSAGYAVSFH